MLRERRCTGICTFIVALIIHGVAQFLISRRLPLIDAALAPPRGSNLHTERKGKVLTRDTFLPNKQQNPIAHYNGAVFFLLLSPFLPRRRRYTGSNPFLSFSFSRRRVPTKKLTNRPRDDAQVRLFIKKFLLRSAQQKHTSSSFGAPLEKPVCSAATITTAIASFREILLYNTILYCVVPSNFACLDLTRLARGPRRSYTRRTREGPAKGSELRGV